jgi:YggT family protein
VTALLSGYDLLLAVLRVAVLAIAIFFGFVALVDWAVRTRRVRPFGAVARMHRRALQPMIAPMERRLVRSGGLPASAALWLLGAVVVGGILLLVVMGFLRGQLIAMAYAGSAGVGGLIVLAAGWGLRLLEIALLVRVVASWLRISEWSRWIRWSVVLTEWLLRPLRRVIPPFGMLDLTPLIAWFLIQLVGNWLIARLASVVVRGV